jgi:hypothetical protein
MRLYWPVLTLPLSVSFTKAVLSIGSLLIGLVGFCLGTWPAANPLTKFRKINVFLAAPVNSTRTGPENEKSVNWKFPPPYRSTAPLNTQRTQSEPSTPNAPPLTAKPKSVKCCVIGGTVGNPPPPTINGEGFGSCAQVDVWLPERQTSTVETPNANDTNAIVILDITPPIAKGTEDCASWKWHYGKSGNKLISRQFLILALSPEVKPG